MKLTSLAVRGFICMSAVACAAAAGAPAIASAAGAQAVPKGFKASAMSWTSASNGWVLGAESCGLRHNCKTSQVVATTNGGKSWHLVGTIHAQIPKLGLGTAGITEIRMATSKVGWIFAPGLYRTADGGKTWRKVAIPGSGKQVLSLAVTPDAAYAITSPCGYMMGLCKGNLTAWRTNLTAASWTRMKLPQPLHANVEANVAAYGKAVYIVNDRVENSLHTQLLVSTDGGARFASKPNPCTAAQIFNLVQAAPYSATKVGLFCDGNPGFGKAVKAVYLSRDNGTTDRYAGTLPPYGIQAQLAISPSGNLLVASYSIGSFIDINDSHGTTWHQIIGSGDGGAGMNDPAYVSKNEAWVVYGPASMFADYGELLKTTDGGRHWTQRRFR